MKRLLTVMVVGAGLLAGGGSANAASLVYIDSAGGLAAAKPDGSGVRKMVSGEANVAAISVDGNGRIAYFSKTDADSFHFLIDKEGKRLAGPFLFGNVGLCGAIPPFRSAFSPDGTWIAATYVQGNACDSAGFTLTTRLIDSDGPTANGAIYGSTTDLVEPRFVRQNQPWLSGIINNEINIWQSPDSPTMAPWINLGSDSANWDIDSFDYHPTMNRMIMEQSPAGTPSGGERRDFLLLDFESPGSANLSSVCTFDGLVASSELRARPRYSPDGSQIAWSGPAGIFTSPAPVNGGSSCTLSPKLVVPGGSEVEWAPFNLSQPPPVGKVQITGVSGLTRAGFRKGSTVKIKAPAAGLVRVSATVPKATARNLKLVRNTRGAVTVAAASRKATKAGTISIKLRPTAKAKAAWKKLAGVRVTLRAVQNSRSATRTIRLKR